VVGYRVAADQSGRAAKTANSSRWSRPPRRAGHASPGLTTWPGSAHPTVGVLRSR